MLATVVLFVLALPVCAQVKTFRSRETMDSVLNPALHPSALRILRFVRSCENIGTIYESDSPRRVVFDFVNVGEEPVTITKVTTHCGCTGATHATEPVEPGDTSQVVVTYNPKGRSGTIDTNAFVYTSCSGNRPVAKLTILGNVVDIDEWSHLPVKMGALRLKRKSATFTKGRTEARIVCANVGTVPLRLSAQLLPSYATFATEPQVIEPGEEGDIVLGIKGDRPDGVKNFSFLVEGVTGNISTRTIKVTIE